MWAIALLLGVLVMACGKYGPPVRSHAEPPAAKGAQATSTPSPEESEEAEEQP